MSSVIKCCKDCTERNPTCHGSCERYLEEKSAAIELHREITSHKIMGGIISDVQYTGLAKARKRK